MEKAVAEDEMGRQHHQLNRYEFERTPGDREGQRSQGCCIPWGCKESGTTQRMNNNKLNKGTITITDYYYYFIMLKIFYLLDWTNPDLTRRKEGAIITPNI